MIYDYSKMRGKIKEIYGTQSKFAKDMELSSVSISLKLNSKAGFTQNEIKKSCELLYIPEKEIPQYFFCVRS